MGDYPVTVYFSRSCFGFGRKNYAEVYVSRAGIKGPLYYEGDRVKRLRGLIEHQDEERQRMGLRKVLGSVFFFRTSLAGNGPHFLKSPFKD